MNIISWNARGLGRPAKRFLVKDFLNMHFVDVCCLQESKLEDISSMLWRDIGRSRLDQFFCVPVQGSARGIIIGWNSVILEAKLLKVGSFSFTVEFRSKRDNMMWRCTSVFGPNARNLKHSFWEELKDAN
ncbi:DNase I-like protein [Dioscorea alata]|uniref:DNase I-like protein n=1 Tax=Dioscorea alata TaxID=55571 RepID=A0ACB7UYG9_DIOAL|nr:DNase I-like protein [Dioscorea alata]